MDAVLLAMCVHRAHFYHLDVTQDIDTQNLEGYPDRWHPDIENKPCLVVRDGETLARSPVGSIIGSTAILYCEEDDIRESDRVHLTWGVYYVNGTPQRTYDVLGPTPTDAYVVEVGLRENRKAPE